MVRGGIEPRDPLKSIYKLACRQGNMSFKTLHPGLLFKESSTLHKRCRATPVPSKPFAFSGLPAEVQAEIFRMWLVKPTVIHCISRTDPHGENGISSTSGYGQPKTRSVLPFTDRIVLIGAVTSMSSTGDPHVAAWPMQSSLTKSLGSSLCRRRSIIWEVPASMPSTNSLCPHLES